LAEAQTFYISEIRVATNPHRTYLTMNTSKSTTSFTGTSQNGDLAEALKHAIKQAMDSSQIADVLVTWTIEKISGKSGGIALGLE
jgi:flagellar hook-basal body complex protein FliE